MNINIIFDMISNIINYKNLNTYQKKLLFYKLKYYKSFIIDR